MNDENEIYVSLGLKIKELRLKKGINQQELADELGITRSSLAHYEKGTRKMYLETLRLFADYFGVTMDDLLGNEYSKIDDKTTHERVSDLIKDYNLSDSEYSKLIDYLEFIVLKREKDSENLKKGLDQTLFELKEQQYEVFEEQENSEQTYVRTKDEKIR